jgi:hypothetical protein
MRGGREREGGRGRERERESSYRERGRERGKEREKERESRWTQQLLAELGETLQEVSNYIIILYIYIYKQ